MQLKEGSILQNGKYRIIRVLGQGGFGITYLAENMFLDKQVAIKEFFPKELCGRDNTSHLTLGTQNNAETVEKLKSRFLKEAKNIAKLDYPGIVKIHDVFEENNTAYYVMDYIEGISLSDMVKVNGPLPESKAIGYVIKVGDALEYIHSRQMTHFDVKPANIMVRKSDDTPILIDFGLSKQYDAHGDATSTIMQGVSHGFSPIELYSANSVATFSPQTDVYSLGATLFFLLTGAIPPSASQVLEEGLQFPANISPDICSAIKRAMCANRTKRYKSIKNFCQPLLKGISERIGDKIEQNITPEKDADIEETKIVKTQGNLSPIAGTQRKYKCISADKDKVSNDAGKTSWWNQFVKWIGRARNIVTPNTGSKSQNAIHLSFVVIIIIAVLSIIFFIKPVAEETNVQSIASEKISFPTPMNLGLSVQWADVNIGATKPYECGDYFAITPSTINNINHMINSNFGEEWRLPTLNELIELFLSTAQIYTQYNNIKLVEFVKSGHPECDTIVFPYAGWSDFGKNDFVNIGSCNYKNDETYMLDPSERGGIYLYNGTHYQIPIRLVHDKNHIKDRFNNQNKFDYDNNPHLYDLVIKENGSIKYFTPTEWLYWQQSHPDNTSHMKKLGVIFEISNDGNAYYLSLDSKEVNVDKLNGKNVPTDIPTLSTAKIIGSRYTKLEAAMQLYGGEPLRDQRLLIKEVHIEDGGHLRYSPFFKSLTPCGYIAIVRNIGKIRF